MTDTLFVHIGTAKTATSLMQNKFAREHALDTLGINYPVVGREPDHSVAHHALARLVAAGDADRIAQLVAALERGQNALLSSEAFASNIAAGSRKLESTRGFLDAATSAGWRIKLIAFVREATDFFGSMHLQTMRTGSVVPFPQYVAERRGWYDKFFGNLRGLDADQSVYAFVPKRYGSDWQDALDVSEPFDTSSHVNTRLSLKAQALFLEYEEFARDAGLELSRRQALRKFAVKESPFEDDTFDFTVWPPSLAGEVRAEALEAARLHGFTTYGSAFSSQSSTESPYVQISAALLSDRDRQVAREFLSQS